MDSLALLLTLASASITDVDVEALTVDELLVEETRLSHPLPQSTPGVMMGLGFAIGAAGFTVLALNLSDGTGTGFLGTAGGPLVRIFGGVTGAMGAMLLVSGMLATSFRASERELGGLRIQQVRARLDVTGRVPLDGGAVMRDRLKVLEDAKPTWGPPIAWLLGGLVATVVGGASAVLINTPSQRTSVGVAEICVGVVLIGVSIWQLIARSAERDAIEDERLALIRQ